ncbi:MAG: hypothetical protein WAV41_02885 [Microgenomates group bacterium]
MKKTLIVLSLLVSSFQFLVSPAFADDEVRRLVLDLRAKGFTQTQWFDNLSSSNIIFAPADKFQLEVKISNQGNRNQTQVVVRQTLPSTVTSDSPIEFTIPQIVAGQDYVKNVTITIKDKSSINKALTNNSLRYSVRSEIGTESSDFVSFFTNNGTKEAARSNTPVLPKTGTATTLLFGSSIAAALAFAGLKLRQLVRGY